MSVRKIFVFVLFQLVVFAVGIGTSYAVEAIKVGAIYSTTGDMSSIDSDSLRGVRLAVDQINSAGGLLDGRPLVVLVEDAKSREDSAAMAAIQLLERRVSACFGHNDPNFVYPSASLFQKAGIPFITSGATLPDLPERIGDHFFMVAFGDDQQAYAIADYAVERLKVKKAIILQNNSADFTRTLSKYFQSRFLSRGGRLFFRDRI